MSLMVREELDLNWDSYHYIINIVIRIYTYDLRMCILYTQCLAFQTNLYYLFACYFAYFIMI